MLFIFFFLPVGSVFPFIERYVLEMIFYKFSKWQYLTYYDFLSCPWQVCFQANFLG